MRTINKVILIGNVTKDPFVKTTTGNKKVATFTIATNRYYKNASGEALSEAEYTNCVTWGPLAERAEQFLVKGKLVYIALPSRQKEVVFTATAVAAGSVVFENPAHDFPSRISYTLQGDKLEAKASGNKPSGPAEESWTLQRMPDRPVPGAQPAAGTVDGPK